MSNEWKDYQADLRSDFESNVECFDYDLPIGWVKSFIPKFKDELFTLLGPYAGDFEVLQVKQKWEALRLYWHFPDRDYYNDEDYDCLEELVPKVDELINKYVDISKKTCVVCGEPATYITNFGYIAPYCGNCDTKRIIKF